MKSIKIIITAILFSFIVFLIPDANSTTSDYNQAVMERLKIMNYAVTDITTATSKSGITAISKFQQTVGLPVTGKVDDDTVIAVIMEEAMYSLAKKGNLIKIKLDKEAYAVVNKLPKFASWYTSKNNPIKNQDDIVAGIVVGCFPGDYSSFLFPDNANDTKSLFAKSQVRIIGNAYWKELFTKENNGPKLFVTEYDKKSDNTIIESGGGIRVKFVLKK